MINYPMDRVLEVGPVEQGNTSASRHNIYSVESEIRLISFNSPEAAQQFCEGWNQAMEAMEDAEV